MKISKNLKTSIFASSLFFNSGCQSLEKTTEVAYCPAGQFLVEFVVSGNLFLVEHRCELRIIACDLFVEL